MDTNLLCHLHKLRPNAAPLFDTASNPFTSKNSTKGPVLQSGRSLLRELYRFIALSVCPFTIRAAISGQCSEPDPTLSFPIPKKRPSTQSAKSLIRMRFFPHANLHSGKSLSTGHQNDILMPLCPPSEPFLRIRKKTAPKRYHHKIRLPALTALYKNASPRLPLLR